MIYPGELTEANVGNISVMGTRGSVLVDLGRIEGRRGDVERGAGKNDRTN